MAGRVRLTQRGRKPLRHVKLDAREQELNARMAKFLRQGGEHYVEVFGRP